MQLQPLLSEYLLETGTLPLAVSRQLCIVQHPAVLQEDGSIVTSPSSSILFSEINTADRAQQDLITFISTRLSITPTQAAELLDREGNIEKAFAETDVVDWPAIGQFLKQADGNISFVQAPAFNYYLPGTIRKQNKQQPTVEPVTEAAAPEVPGEAIYELHEPEQRDKWWVWAIVIFVLSLLLILLRFSGWM